MKYYNLFALAAIFSSSLALGSDEEKLQLTLNQLHKDIKKSLIIISELRKAQGKTMHDFNYNFESPSQEVVHLGMVIDFENIKNGLNVFSVSPNSLASRIGIKNNDIIFKVNGVDVLSSTSSQIISELQKLADGDTLELSVRRGNDIIELSKKVTGVFIPSIKLAIGEDFTPEDKGTFSGDNIENGCGRVSVFFVPPSSLKLEAGYFTYIDDYKIDKLRNSFRLSPGKHKIELQSSLDRQFKAPSQLKRENVTALNVNIEKDKVYYLGLKRDSIDSSLKAVVWKKDNMGCY